MKLDKEFKNKINYLFDVLKKNDVARLCVSFYGSGDDGNMEVYDVANKSDEQVNINLEEPTIYDLDLNELIFNITDHLLDNKNIDYCNDNGNNGSVIYIVEGKNVEMNYLITKDAEYSFSV